MNRLNAFVLLIVLAACSTSGTTPIDQTSSTMLVGSSVASQGTRLPEAYTCSGRNVSPPLDWSGYDANTTLELALIMDDIDASNFVHWVVYGIPPDVIETALDQPPQGSKQGTNGFGKPGYSGPCPPRGAGPHRYVFTVYALNARLPLVEGATADVLRAAMKDHIIDSGTLTVKFGRL